MQTDSVEKAAGIGAIGLWAALHGWLGWLVVLYAVCMMLDWVTGTVLAIKNGVWSSHKARQGLWHKCGSIIMIFVSVLTDILLGLTLNHISGLTLPFNYDMLLTPISSDSGRYSIFFAFMKECRYNRTISLKREVSPMNLYISAAEYDYHTLLKVAEMAGLAGIIGFHEAGDGYLVTFPQGENVQALIDDYKGRLRDLENNIWQH